MLGKLRRKLKVLLAGVFLIGVFLMLHQSNQYRQAEQKQAQAQQIAMQPVKQAPTPTTEPVMQEVPEEKVPLESFPEPDEQAKQMMALDIKALQTVNPDVLGWITIPDTNINYPLMAADTADEYLHTAWDGSKSYSGSIYLETQNNRAFSDFHSIIYGHNMANGTMFGNLILYKKQEFLQTHPYVYIVSGGTVRRYEIFAAYYAQVGSDTYYINFSSEQRRQEAIDYYLEQSFLTSERIPTAQDRLLTLSTCTGTGDYSQRLVVQAVLDISWKY